MSFHVPVGTRGGPLRNGPFMRLVNRFVVRRAKRSASASLGGMRVMALSTVGAKSGERRQTPVAWFDGGDGTWLVVASASGATRNPAWFHNIVAHPDEVAIDVGGRHVEVTPEQLQGREREDALASIIASAPNFAGYGDRTDREIPVIRLRERTGTA